MTAFPVRAGVTAGALAVATAFTLTAEAATSFGGTATVGAIFPNTTATGYHSCSASVVASASRDTIITAAHCIAGSGTSFSFAPGYVKGAKPYGAWRVTRAYIDPRWKSGQNPAYDVAVLTVAPHYIGGRWKNIQDITGGNVIHSAPANGSYVTVTGYNAGSGDRPVKCTARTFYTSGYPGFSCSGYNPGVSGSPFVQTISGASYVSGVIGGLHQGGCYSWISYTSPFGTAARNLVYRAQTHSRADVVPYAGDDGC